MSSDPYLSIITVSYNSTKTISKFLENLEKFRPSTSEVIIVDNNSVDDTVEIIKKFSFVKLIQNNKNLGFSKGNNIGAKSAKGQYLLFLNPDICVKKNSIDELLTYMRDNPEVGIAGPKLYESEEKVQASVSPFPTFWGAFKEYILKIDGSYKQYAPKTSKPVEVDVVYGAAMLIKSDVFDQIGGFNEKYFLFYEDIDICKKIKKLGLKVVYDPRTSMSHIVGASMKKEDKMNFLQRNISWFLPIRKSGARYFLVRSSQIYHGKIISLFIQMTILIGTKLDLLYE